MCDAKTNKRRYTNLCHCDGSLTYTRTQSINREKKHFWSAWHCVRRVIITFSTYTTSSLNRNISMVDIHISLLSIAASTKRIVPCDYSSVLHLLMGSHESIAFLRKAHSQPKARLSVWRRGSFVPHKGKRTRNRRDVPGEHQPPVEEPKHVLRASSERCTSNSSAQVTVFLLRLVFKTARIIPLLERDFDLAALNAHTKHVPPSTRRDGGDLEHQDSFSVSFSECSL